MKKIRKYLLIIPLIVIAILVYTSYLSVDKLLPWMGQLSTGFLFLWTAIALALNCFLYVTTVVSGRVKAADTLSLFVKNLIFGAVATLIIFLLSISSIVSSDVFYWIAALIVIVVFVSQYLFFKKRFVQQQSSNSIRKSAEGAGEIRYSYSALYGSVMFASFCLLAGLIIGYDVKALLFAYSAVAVAFFLWRVTSYRGWLLLVIISVSALMCCYINDCSNLSHSVIFMSLLTFSLISLLAPLVDLYVRKEQNL